MIHSVFQGRSFLAEKDFSCEELTYLIDFAIHLKSIKSRGISHQYLKGKTIALLFEKTSTRTRSAFTVAAVDLGAHPEFLGKEDIQLGNKESIADTAKVLGSMFDGIEFRGSKQKDVEELAKYAGVPVWNGLTDQWHPTQMIADFMTIKEHFGSLEGKTLTFMGDGRNNVATSLLVTGAILGVNICICTPPELYPPSSILKLAEKYAEKSGSKVKVTADVSSEIEHTDVLYTDVWFSMGEEEKIAERIKLLTPYQITMKTIEETHTPNLMVLHCLPAFHDTETSYGTKIFKKHGLKELEITDEVFQSSYGYQFQQAENRMHSIKAIMAATLGNLFIPKV